MEKEKYTFELSPFLVDLADTIAQSQGKDLNKFVELVILKAVHAHHLNVLSLGQAQYLESKFISFPDSKK